MGVIVALLGILILLVGSIMMIIEAFKTSIVWGLLVLFCGPAWLVFLILHWEHAKRPLLVSIMGFVIYVGGIVMTGGKIGRLPSSQPSAATRNLE